MTQLDAPTVSRRFGNLVWEVLPDWVPLLLDEHGLRLTQWEAAGAVELVQNRPARTVCCVRLADRAVFIKHDRRPGLLRAMARWIRGGSAARESRATLEAARRGLPTIRPVGWAQRRAGVLVLEDYYVTEAVPDAVRLDQFLVETADGPPTQQRPFSRRRLLESFARLVAQIQEAGLRHGDLHAGNVLVRLDAAGRPEMRLIDLAGARFSGPLDWKASLPDLVAIHAQWFDRATVAERWRFWRVYRTARPGLDVPDRDAVVRQLDRGAREHARRVSRRRDRRALKTNRHFARRQDHRGTIHAVRDLPEPVGCRFLADPDAHLWHPEAEPVKISLTSLIVRVAWPLGEAAVGVALKRCRPKNGWKAFCEWFRTARAVRGWSLGHALLSRGIATARPLAVWRPRRWTWGRTSYLATEWIEGAENVHLWGWRRAVDSPTRRLRWAARCATSLGRLLGRMHARCVSHRDLKAANLLVRASGETLQTWLIDPEGARIRRRLGLRRRAADLARLAVSLEAHPWVTPAVRYRFLVAYAAEFPRGEIDVKRLWRDVARRAARRIHHKRRRDAEVL